MSHPAYLINEDRWDEPDPFRELDQAILRQEEAFQRPADVLAARVVDLEAKLALADEDRFWQTAEIARLNAQLGQTTYQTVKSP